MCLITFAWQQHPQATLLLAANRDEFHARPTAPAALWNDAPGLLAGRDLEAGGTWLGVTESGRFAAITNVRDPDAGEKRAPRSRGELTGDFLRGTSSPEDYLDDVARRVDDYQGFNLLVGDRDSLWYLLGSDKSARIPRALRPGIYGLSNAALDVPWPKVRRARDRLAEVLRSAQASLPDEPSLLSCVNNRELSSEEALHGHGLSGEMARALSAQFIVTPSYGTRCSTTLISHRNGSTLFKERRYDESGETQGEEQFVLGAGAAY